MIRPERMEVVLLGFGQIGRALATLLSRVDRDRRSRLRVAAVIDRSGFVFDPDGISPRRLARWPRRSARGRRLADLPKGQEASAADGRRAYRRLRADPARCWWTSPPTTPSPRWSRR